MDMYEADAVLPYCKLVMGTIHFRSIYIGYRLLLLNNWLSTYIILQIDLLPFYKFCTHIRIT